MCRLRSFGGLSCVADWPLALALSLAFGYDGFVMTSADSTFGSPQLRERRTFKALMSERLAAALAVLVSLILPLPAWAQDRGWEQHWALHGIWWPVVILAVTLFLLTLLGWALLNLAPMVLAVIAAVMGIRWLRRATEGSRSDPAVALLRERYARGEISKEEFDAKLRDLGAQS